MTNRDKRGFILSMVLGDGCLHYHKRGNTLYGSLSIDHGVEQSDYVTWKSKIVSEILKRPINVRQGHKGKSIQFQVCDKKFRVWRKFCYPNDKKSLTKILPYINNPEFAVMVWLMDDGYVEPSKFNGVNQGARFRIFTCNESIEDQNFFIEWFQKNLNVKPKIHYMTDKRTKKTYPFLKFNQADSLVIWEKIREVVLGLKSMQYKFRYIEEIYQKKLLQRIPSES